MAFDDVALGGGVFQVSVGAVQGICVEHTAGGCGIGVLARVSDLMGREG